MSEQDENGNPKYAERMWVTFDAAGPNHRTGAGWIDDISPIRTRAGDIEPVYRIRVHTLDGKIIEPTDPHHEVMENDRPWYIFLGEPEITSAVPTDSAESEPAHEP